MSAGQEIGITEQRQLCTVIAGLSGANSKSEIAGKLSESLRTAPCSSTVQLSPQALDDSL
ncbi:hypothetical protein M378DRAFT_12071 [Amanita muscaria Koide BX008]|uniref:Uncharacterized protein n=1 Tax=Amanita muscaria (strain Koide BX008) TaxID=946122 RepID=A0A0C2X376_AMAMK|nr:hypothetical protein M378DRAFT_12071 [Amanita muscaria Koide BX008]